MKKLFAILMIVMMVVCFMPSMAFAVDGTAGNDDNGVVFSKTAVQNDDGSVEITLKAYTTSRTVTSISSKPVDIVLVLDQSGSMKYDFSGKSTKVDENRRQFAMKNAVTNFIDNIDPNGEHRVSVVTFGSDASTLAGWTEANEAGKMQLKNAVNGLSKTPDGATNVAAGMNTAASLLESANADSQKVVIVFTDGVPTEHSDFSTKVANDAISAAKAMKNAGAKVYTIGIFDDANPAQLYGDKFDRQEDILGLVKDDPCNGNVGEFWGYTNILAWVGGGEEAIRGLDIAATNRFLNYLSNNFEMAEEIGIEEYSSGLLGGQAWKITKNFERSYSKYYLTASDASGLSKVFETIQSETMVPAIELDASTVIRDGISAYFNAPAATDVKVYTAAYNGTSFDETSLADITSDVTIDVSSEKVVTVTGFNFNDNYTSSDPRPVNGEEFYGKELIIKFTVTPNYEAIDSALNAGSLTRNADGADYKVPTNTDAQILKETEVVAAADGQSASMHTVTYQVTGENTPRKIQLRAAGAQVQKEADLAAHTAWTSEQIAATDISTSGCFTMPDKDVLFTCKENTPVIPDKPAATDINGLSEKVQVECEIKTTGHAEKLYDLTDFSISEVQGTEGNYYVTLTVPAAPYVAKYVKVYGEHKQVATDPGSGELKATYDGEKWSVAETAKIVFHVECEVTPAPVVPDKPNATDINGLTGKVQVECESKTTEHAEALYDLTDFVISEVQGNEGNYYVTLTVSAAPYVAKYAKAYGEHKQVATDPVSRELKVIFDGQNWHINNADKIVFHVECSTQDPNPDKPPVYPTHYYTVKWNNYDNTNLETDYCTYYQMPTYDSATPARPADEEYTYEFIGWDKEVVRVTGDAVYTAQFKAVAKVQPKPEDPADPTNPEKPGKPDKPAKPEKPAKPDKPDTEVPKTGDISADNMIINLFLLTSSALAAALLWYRKYARK